MKQDEFTDSGLLKHTKKDGALRTAPYDIRLPILLLAEEDAERIDEAFELGMEDVLIRPYNTGLNKCRVRQLGQMSITNRKLSQMLEHQLTP